MVANLPIRVSMGSKLRIITIPLFPALRVAWRLARKGRAPNIARWLGISRFEPWGGVDVKSMCTVGVLGQACVQPVRTPEDPEFRAAMMIKRS